MIHTYCAIVFLQLLCFTGASESGIVGGKVAKPHSRPYMASLQYDGCHSCGGILIRDDFVLTAAHCKYPEREITVILGAHKLYKEEKSQQRIEVAEYFAHPEYSNGFDNDIMLLKLKTKAKLNKYVKVIELPKENGQIPAKVKCVAAGWGITGHNKPRSNVLKEATETLLVNNECKNIWQQHFNSEHMICTKFDKKNGGVCQGDSGGPLICESKPQGITSFTDGNDCTNPKSPHVFTKVHYYLPWIKKVMQGLGNVA